MQILLFVLGFLLFIGLVLVHEYGHYKVARGNGVIVEEFGLGFPPRAWSRRLKKSKMILSLNWLPIGGFVRLKGEHDADTRPGSFGAASLTAKTKIMLAGVTLNLIVGLILLTAVAWIGLPRLIDPAVAGQEQFTVKSDTQVTHQSVAAGYIQPGGPASKTGIASRDTIIEISGGGQNRSVKNSSELKAATKTFAGQTVWLTYKHNNQLKTERTKLLSTKEVEQSQNTSDPKGYLGVVPLELQLRRSSWSAPIVALGFTRQIVLLTLQGIWHALSGLGSTIAGLITGNQAAREAGQAQASSQVGGPIAIMAVLWGSGSLGLNFILTIIAVLSLTLALINILPIPALDGGRLAVTLFSRGLLKRPLSKTAEERIHGTGMALLLGLVLLITIVDVKRFF